MVIRISCVRRVRRNGQWVYGPPYRGVQDASEDSSIEQSNNRTIEQSRTPAISRKFLEKSSGTPRSCYDEQRNQYMTAALRSCYQSSCTLLTCKPSCTGYIRITAVVRNGSNHVDSRLAGTTAGGFHPRALLEPVPTLPLLLATTCSTNIARYSCAINELY